MFVYPSYGETAGKRLAMACLQSPPWCQLQTVRCRTGYGASARGKVC